MDDMLLLFFRYADIVLKCKIFRYRTFYQTYTALSMILNIKRKITIAM